MHRTVAPIAGTGESGGAGRAAVHCGGTAEPLLGMTEGLTRVQPLRSALHVAGEWAMVVAASALATASGTPWSLVLLVPFVAARQHALAALAHEAAHGRLFPLGRRPGFWNLALSEPLVAWPLGLSIRSYRRVHLAHHRALNTDADPDWVRNRPDLWRPDLWRSADWRSEHEAPGRLEQARHLLGASARQAGLLALFSDGGARRSARASFARAAYMLAVAAAVTWAGGWRVVALHWLLPLFTWFPLLMRARGLAEHWSLPPGVQSRTTLLSPIGRLLFLPKNIGYHAEHHRHPSVPFHALPRLHRRLAAAGEAVHVTRGITGLAREIAGGAPLRGT